MPIYVYECPDHGTCDVLVRTFKVDEAHLCPECGEEMVNVLTAPAVINIERDWNEKANDYQTHGPYHQAKSQLENIKRQQAERGEPNTPITEEAIQVGAKAIDEQANAPPGPSIEEKYVRRIRGK
jgi:putative FmdB family regulatory protein